jgi:predicted MPP superfamily phosphohydrolase
MTPETGRGALSCAGRSLLLRKKGTPGAARLSTTQAVILRPPSRRRVWAWSTGFVGCVVVLGLWAFWLEPASLTVAEHELSLGWPGERSLRVAVLTDLHVGSPFNGWAKLRSTVDRTNAAQPDVICILGDLVIQGVLGGRFVPPEEIAIELARLRSAAGIVAVLGNHDGWFDHDRVRQALETIGIRVVEDTAIRLSTPAGTLWIAGMSDLWTGRHDLAAALSAVADDVAPVLY